ncbi:unnamed protein product [Brachionus calyciflorus]|uniref:SUEL-type lectin domain-containing protein n=1 Tax=Brachionus calyciflorus TaxID=104777 RepID=A0A814BL31_9BILA|nr:unnamed protein product [Brachionus calyciflorus]
MNFINEKILRKKFRTKVFKFHPPDFHLNSNSNILFNVETHQTVKNQETATKNAENTNLKFLNKCTISSKSILAIVFIIFLIGLVLVIFLRFQYSSSTVSTDVNENKIFVSQSRFNSSVNANFSICEHKKLIDLNTNDRKCSRISPYEPENLNFQNSYSLGQPIFQSIVCFGSKLHLKCPMQNQKIHISSAYFGIQKQTKNFCWSNPKGLVCYRNLTLHYIQNLCENKSLCNLIVTDTYLGNPCPTQNLNHNQLLIQYQCLDDENFDLVNKKCEINKEMSPICPALKIPNYNEKYWCEPNKANITCPYGKVINILCSFYGVDVDKKCPDSEYKGVPTKCYSENTQFIIKNFCNNKTSCFFSGENSFEQDSGFTNACQGFQNMFFVQWECISEYLEYTISSKTIDLLPICNSTPSINGTCDTSYSPYVPQALNNSTKTYFSYPIYQQIVCQGSTLILFCPAETVIHIYAGYFGIQEYTRSNFCITSENEDKYPFMLYIADSFKTINSTCENKNMCQLRAMANSLGGGDLNPEYTKQLVVQYQCLDPILLQNRINQCEFNSKIPEICPKNLGEDKMNEDTWCDGDQMSIKCSNEKKIKIFCAFYGIHPSILTCDIASLSFSPVCYFNSSFANIVELCELKSNCSIDVVGSSFFNLDPCIGLKKALYVQWKCI